MTDIAAFDFDGTLTTGGSVLPFLVAVSDRSTVASAIAALWPRLLHAALSGGSVADQGKEDLFERVFETVSLFNVDLYREQEAMTLRPSQRRSKPIAHDHLPEPNHAMGSRDRLRNSDTPMPSPTPNEPLPLTEHARTRHRELADLEGLKAFICNYPGRIRRLVRRPFAIEPGENSGVTSMRMPPFMRNSNAEPLTLSQWQYDLLMQWVDEHTPTAKQQKTPRKLSPTAKARRDAVLARVGRNARQPKS